MLLTVLIIAAVLGLYMAWNIGANDVANSMADAVGSNALSIRNAVILAGICEFAGAVLVGSHVTDTVRKGIVDPNHLLSIAQNPTDAAVIMVIGMTSALLAAAIWLNISSYLGMPVSTTHSIVGAVAGFGIIAAGWDAVNWSKMAQIVASWFISPLAGGVIAFILFMFISRFILGRDRPVRSAKIFVPYIVFLAASVVSLATIYKGFKNVIGNLPWLTDNVSLAIAMGLSLVFALGSKWWLNHTLAGKEKLAIGEQLDEVEKVFIPLVIVTSCSVAFAHGANDVANAVGPLAAVVNVVRTGTVEMRVGVPMWIMVLGGVGIVTGLATYGYRVMRTVGSDITEITPSRGVAADIAATATVLVCSRLKLPVSTTHTLVGAIIGIGMARGLTGINSAITKKIFNSWILTVPAAAIVSMVFYVLGRLFVYDYLTRLINMVSA